MDTWKSFRKALSFFTKTHDYLNRSEKPGASMVALKQAWARDVLASVGVTTSTKGEPIQNETTILVSNHVSYLDIPLLMSVVPDVAFIAKKEIAGWPVIGRGARALGTVLVNRSNAENRSEAKDAIVAQLKAGQRIAVFPSGTTCMRESKRWSKGVFEIAQKTGISIQPFRVRYTPLRLAAYIGWDNFPVHLFQLALRGGAHATIEFHPPQTVENAAEAAEHWRTWSRIPAFATPPQIDNKLNLGDLFSF